MGQPANSIYCASKWALEGWGESLAYEMVPFGIKVILVEPGPYRTEIWRSTPRVQPQDSA
jgi:short-subunit dehydrogenase